MKLKIIAIFLVFLIVNSSFTYADIIEDVESGVEKTGEALSEFEATDIIINVDSYQPTVLQEQAFESDQPGGYPIIATLRGMKTNPIMDLQRIMDMNVRATGKSRDYVSNIYYKKPRYGYFDLNNMGYIVIRLKKLKEDEVPKRLDINMTANIIFEIENGFGINEQDLILPILSEEEFLNRKSEFSFYSGRGYVRLVNIRNNVADMIVYDGRLQKDSLSVKEGKGSSKQSLRGGTPYLFFKEEEDIIGRNLRNTYRIRVNQITGNKDKAKVEMFFNGEYKQKELTEGQYLYTGSKWKVDDIKITDEYDEVILINQETRDRKVLRGGRLYIPSEEEEEVIAQYKFSKDVDYGDLIIKYSSLHNVNPALIAAIVEQESSFDKDVIGDDGEVGLMQLMPDTASGLGMTPIYNLDLFKSDLSKYIEDLENIKKDSDRESKDIRFNAEENIKGGVKYFKEQLERFNGDEKLALAAYNAGPSEALNECVGKSYDECSDKLSNTKYVEDVWSKRSYYENILEITPEEDLEDKEEEIVDEELYEEYKKIKLDLDKLISEKPNIKNEVDDVLNEYKIFLDKVNGIKYSRLSSRYKGLIINDLMNLEETYKTIGIRSDDKNDPYLKIADDIQEFVTDVIGPNLNIKEEEFLEKEKLDYTKDTPEYYFEKAIEEYKDVVNKYRDAVYNDRNVARDAQEKIAKIYDDNLKRYDEAIQEYRNLISLFDYEEKEAIENRIKFLEIRRNYKTDTINIYEYGNSIQLTLYGSEKASTESKARINIDGESNYNYIAKNRNKLGNTNWYLKEINVDNIVIAKLDKEEREITKRLKLDEKEVIDNHVFVLEDVDIKQEAHITILPGEERLTTQSTFMLHIPVEPRLWKLSTEQMNEHINFTKNAINTLNNYINIVENVYKWWSISCYSTFAILWIKNLFWFGAKDRSLARKAVMSSWKEECESDVSKGAYKNVFDCIVSKQKEINDDLNKAQNVYDLYKDSEEVDKRILAFAKENFNNQRLNKYYDEEAFNILKRQNVDNKLEDVEESKRRDEYVNRLEEFLNNDELFEGKDIDKESIEKIREELGKGSGFTLKEDGKFARVVNIKSEIESSKLEVEEDISKSLYYKGYLYRSPNNYESVYSSVYDEGGNLFEGELNLNKIYYYRDPNTGKLKKFKFVDRAVEVQADHQRKVVLINSGKWKGHVDRISVDSRAYLRVSKRGSDGIPLEVELWIRSSKFGDDNNLPLNAEDAYQRMSSFSLDDCRRGKTSARAGVDVLASLREEHKDLEKACDELIIVDRESKLKEKKVGEDIKGYMIEAAAQETGGLQCFDIMDIGDCLTLFSVCDPVMCPASRFTAGGSWRVDNVVATGIFGSIFLGKNLWDFKRIPPEIGVCVPGIDAGLKNYRSLLQGYQECLIARRDKGENVGICDTIRNIGVCKILWREGTAFFRLSGNVLDKLLGGVDKAAAGGEYGFFQTNMQKTGEFLNFFTKEYATTYFSAYRGASTDEIGEELCKAAIYGKIPGRGNLLDQLTKPEGPVQFIGWFTELPHSDVGGDLTSDYEVYYHIYAGEDREQIRYYVYLRDLDDLSRKLYITRSTGYLNRGTYVDDNVRRTDFTGYDELCIVIDYQENCGFGTVSSDLLVDYIRDKSLESSVERNIKSERECIGESTVFTNPGVGSLVDTFYPNLVRSGLIRVCGSENPGKGVDNSTWTKVGTCGNNSLGQSLGDCWLSKQSYSDALSEYDLERRKKAEEFFKQFEDLKEDKDVKSEIEGLIGERDGLKTKLEGENNEEILKEFEIIINKFIALEDKTINPNLMGKINFEIGETYYELALLLFGKKIEEKALAEEGENKGGEGEKKEEISVGIEELVDLVKGLRFNINIVTPGLIPGWDHKDEWEWDGDKWNPAPFKDEAVYRNADFDKGLDGINEHISLLSNLKKIELECNDKIVSEVSAEGLKNNFDVKSWLYNNIGECSTESDSTKKTLTKKPGVYELVFIKQGLFSFLGNYAPFGLDESESRWEWDGSVWESLSRGPIKYSYDNGLNLIKQEFETGKEVIIKIVFLCDSKEIIFTDDTSEELTDWINKTIEGCNL